MFTPVANKGGRFVGLDDGSWYYTLGWLVFPVNGQYVFYNDGGQTGTNTMVLHIPAKKLSISFACNRQDIDRMPYVKRLYEVVTNQPWDTRRFWFTAGSDVNNINDNLNRLFTGAEVYPNLIKQLLDLRQF